MKTVAFHNLGCKVNAYEAEAMQELLTAHGYEIVPFDAGADVYIINTCTVTNMADRKSRQILHRARKTNPDAIVVAAGCYVQAQKGNIDDGVDIVIGNNHKKDIVRILEEYQNERMDVRKDIAHDPVYEPLTLSHTAEHTRAYIKVQDGCNQFCSYCIIPFVRGRVRSRDAQDVVEETKRLAKNGYQEVVLTGTHLSSYGRDFGSGREDLRSLILRIHEVGGIRRIRLGSLEPRIVTEAFVQTLSSLPKICPHFHLSLQSGCDATLRRMNRHYSAAEYEETCKRLRTYFHRPALTTDVIVGFPGETEEEFGQSREFVDRINFYETHIFKYSRRAGTRAADMPDQVPEPEKTRRSAILLELNRKKKAMYEDALLGTVQEVLMEEEIHRADGTYQIGHTKEYVKIGQKTTENLANRIVNVEIKNPSQIIR